MEIMLNIGKLQVQAQAWHCGFDQFIFDKWFLIFHLVADPYFIRNKGGNSCVKTVHKYLCENY